MALKLWAWSVSFQRSSLTSCLIYRLIPIFNMYRSQGIAFCKWSYVLKFFSVKEMIFIHQLHSIPSNHRLKWMLLETKNTISERPLEDAAWHYPLTTELTNNGGGGQKRKLENVKLLENHVGIIVASVITHWEQLTRSCHCFSAVTIDNICQDSNRRFFCIQCFLDQTRTTLFVFYVFWWCWKHSHLS